MRIAKGYTQESLADLSGVNIKSLSLFEQKPEKLVAASTATVYKLADSLGVDIDDIINKENIKDE
jgi:transcriptional regulator with XRE-family HTH domain